MNFSRRVDSIAVSAIKQMPLVAQSVPGAVSLGQGIPSLPTPKYIRNQLIEWLETDAAIGKYSLQPGLPELKAAVATRVESRAGRTVDPESEIFISAGAMEALFAAMVSIVDEGDEVILFDPGYASHIEQVLFAGGKPVYARLDESAGWAMCRESLLGAVSDKTKAIVLSNPSNPTGHVFSQSDLEFIAELALKHDFYVVTDETYDFLLYDGTTHTSLVALEALKDRIIACYSFSKEFAMTGWRVGYMYAKREIVDQALKVHDAAVICAPTISQYAALIAINGTPLPEDQDIRKVLLERRNLMCNRLDELSDLFSYVKPLGAYYILPRYLKTDLSSHDFAMKLLHEAEVVTIPGRAFGPGGEQHIRLSFGGTEEEINQAFDRIEKWNLKLN